MFANSNFGEWKFGPVPTAHLAAIESHAGKTPGDYFSCSNSMPAFAFAKPTLPYAPRWRFRLVAVAPAGAILSTADHLPQLQIGDEILLAVTLPAIGSFDVPSRITSVDFNGPNECRVHVIWTEVQKLFLISLAEFLLLGDAVLTPARLRQAGFQVENIARAVTFSEAGTEQDYRDILDLRLRAHQHEGRCSSLTAHDLCSPFDAFSSHLVCRLGKRIVSYVRLIEVGNDPNRSQYIQWGSHQVPRCLLQRGFAEAGAGATDPDFQRTGLFLPLMQFAVAKAMTLGYPFILGACDDHLLPM